MDSDPFTANATSRLSSDFRSAVSTSPLEQSLHNVGHLERACSVPHLLPAIPGAQGRGRTEITLCDMWFHGQTASRPSQDSCWFSWRGPQCRFWKADKHWQQSK